MRPGKAIVWGFTVNGCYHTHSHIHYGIWKALRHLGWDAEWLDSTCAPDWTNLPPTLFVTNQDVMHQLPVRSDHTYVAHGGVNNADWRRFDGHRRLSWNVYIDLHENLHENPDVVWLDDDAPFMPWAEHMDFRWATDLLPHEIEANKPLAKAWNPGSWVVHYVGSSWFVNERELAAFRSAAGSAGVQFVIHGAGANDVAYSWMGRSKVVSPEENQRLVRESLFGPAIIGSHHLTEGYLPCRILKNISYGVMGVTNSARVNRMLGGRLVHNDSPHDLFFHARDVLPTLPVERVWELMDVVATRHTYLNRLGCVFQALDMLYKEAV